MALRIALSFALLLVAGASAADQCVKTGWTTVARTGQAYGGGVWGQVKGFRCVVDAAA